MDLNKILEEYKEVFSPNLGVLKRAKIKIVVPENAKPKYKARCVPYALKDAVECELDKLESQGIFKPVNHSKWAVPIVPVVKKDGGIRICGAYKMTVNKVANCDKYSVPKTEDLLATLNVGQKLTKLDLSQAYQQLLLDENSSDYLTINAHKGLFRPTRLQFGVHSAARIF